MKRDWSDLSANQGTLRMAGRPQRLEETKKGSSLEISERAWPSGQLDFTLPASRTVRIHFCCYKPPSLWSFILAALGNESKQ